MECITVLKPNDGVLNKTGYWNQGLNQCVFENLQNEKSNRFRRFCSHFRQNKAIWILMVFVLILFILLLMLFMQIQTLHQELKNQKQTTDEVLHRLKHSESNIASLHQRIEHQLRQCLKQRGRRTTTNGSGTPHFFIRGGSNGNQNDGITQDGIFLWNKGNRQFGQSDVFIAESSGSRVKKLQIQRSGVYYIFADIAVEGRTIDDDRRTRMDNSPFPPPVGYTLYKNDGNNPLRSTFLTQDRMGFKYHSPGTAGYPIDTISLSGLFTLQRGDTIYIQKLGNQINDDRTNYHNIATHASFGGFLVEDFFATISTT